MFMNLISATVVYLVATMSPDATGNGALYVWTNPTFNSVEECQAFANADPMTNVYMHLYEQFGSTVYPTGVWCVEEPALNQYMESYVAPEKTGSNI